jgi:Zinc knuckle
MDSHNGSKRDVQCYYCNKYGHYQTDCYKEQREESQTNYEDEYYLLNIYIII